MGLRAITQKPIQYFLDNQKEIEKFLELEVSYPYTKKGDIGYFYWLHLWHSWNRINKILFTNIPLGPRFPFPRPRLREQWLQGPGQPHDPRHRHRPRRRGEERRALSLLYQISQEGGLFPLRWKQFCLEWENTLFGMEASFKWIFLKVLKFLPFLAVTWFKHVLSNVHHYFIFQPILKLKRTRISAALKRSYSALFTRSANNNHNTYKTTEYTETFI